MRHLAAGIAALWLGAVVLMAQAPPAARNPVPPTVTSIAAGKQADLCAWRIESLAELGYWVGLPGPERRIFNQRVERRRLLVDGRRADEHVLGDDSREKLDVRRDMLERERDPVDDDVEALVAQRSRNGRRVANVGMDRTHATRGVALSAVEQREVDAALGEQLRDRERDVAGAADRENAHVHDVIGVG